MDFKEFFQISMETFKHNPKMFHNNFQKIMKLKKKSKIKLTPFLNEGNN